MMGWRNWASQLHIIWPLPQNLWVIIASFHANHRVFIGYELKKLVSNLTVEFCECRQLEKYGIATDLETQLDET